MISTFIIVRTTDTAAASETTPIPFPRAPAHLVDRSSPGSTNYIDVLDAQRRYFDAQIGLSNSVRDEHLALVQLYKALGGGWTE